MQVFNPNNIKIYNLSSGRSLPEWISDRKRRLLLKKDVDVRNRIELIQDFDMPAVSTGVKVSKDGQYVMATGVYKPRIRCYDVNNLSLKFERCFNAEAVQFEMLSDSYAKFVLLQCDRNIEFHAQYGCYYRTRVPKFGRDLVYHPSSCDLYIVGASSEMYRFNLEQGRFLNSLVTEASSMNKICINPVHDLVVCGTAEGKVEAWDPRDRRKVGTLDCGINCVTDGTNVAGFPSVTALRFKDALTLGTGTSTGQILLFDIRTNKPYTIRDHMNDLEIKNIEFIDNEDLVASMDIKCVKFWNRISGKPFTYIEAPADLNDMCIVPNSGLLFLANEEKKILTYYIPSIGPAPKWCYFLDNITEELEESKADTIYDDYKFVTSKELEELGLSHLVGTNLLKAYMHGYFMDIRLYNKAKTIVQPFAYKDFRKKKIDEKIESERKNRVIMKQLPTVNKILAKKLLEIQTDGKEVKTLPKSRKTDISNHKTIFEEDRFKIMFDNPEFNIDEQSEDFVFVQPVLSQLDKVNQMGKKLPSVSYEQFQAIEEEEAMKEYTSSEDDEEEEGGNSENEVDMESENEASEEGTTNAKSQKLKFYEIKDTERFSMMKQSEDEHKLLPIGERLQKVKETFKEQTDSVGNKQVTFTLQKSDIQKKREEKNKAHIKERAMFKRPAKNLRKR